MVLVVIRIGILAGRIIVALITIALRGRATFTAAFASVACFMIFAVIEILLKRLRRRTRCTVRRRITATVFVAFRHFWRFFENEKRKYFCIFVFFLSLQLKF